MWGIIELVDMWVGGSSTPSGTVMRSVIMSSANLLSSVIAVTTADAV